MNYFPWPSATELKIILYYTLFKCSNTQGLEFHRADGRVKRVQLYKGGRQSRIWVSARELSMASLAYTISLRPFRRTNLLFFTQISQLTAIYIIFRIKPIYAGRAVGRLNTQNWDRWRGRIYLWIWAHITIAYHTVAHKWTRASAINSSSSHRKL